MEHTTLRHMRTHATMYFKSDFTLNPYVLYRLILTIPSNPTPNPYINNIKSVSSHILSAGLTTCTVHDKLDESKEKLPKNPCRRE